MIVCTLSDILHERGISRRELARRANVNVNTVCKLVHNENLLVHLRVLEEVCEVLGVQPGDILQNIP